MRKECALQEDSVVLISGVLATLLILFSSYLDIAIWTSSSYYHPVTVLLLLLAMEEMLLSVRRLH